MLDLLLSKNTFNSTGYWTNPVAKILYQPTKEDVALFDQNGYDLTPIEVHYAYSNLNKAKRHREHHYALKEVWFAQEESKVEGAVLNHSLLFERKGYQGPALEQLQHWAKHLPLLHKIIAIRPKWGLDFSMDYVDRSGNTFEVLHWEWDSFDYNQINDIRINAEAILSTVDWDDAGRALLKRKDEWHHLEFFEQSDWKCKYFGIAKERFKMVIWQ